MWDMTIKWSCELAKQQYKKVGHVLLKQGRNVLISILSLIVRYLSDLLFNVIYL